MAGGEPPNLVNIPNHVYRCLEGFQVTSIHYVSAEPHIQRKIPLDAILDQAGRFKLWSGNIGAHKKGRSSLEYRLREASHLRDRIIELLRDLVTALKEATELLSGDRQPWEDLSDSDSDCSEHGNAPDEDHQTETELAQLVGNTAEIITCLMRLSVTIRNPAPHDQFKKSMNLDMSHYVPFDIDHVRGKFPNAEEFLVLRLGKAISRRRQFLRYRAEHRQKLGSEMSSAPLDGAPLAAAPSVKPQSTVASSLPLALKTSHTFKVEDDNEVLSQTSYASSHSDLEKLRPPPLPETGLKGGPFECPLCYRMTIASQTILWHKHVYRDLQPFLCTYQDCTVADHTYESRHDWFTHELETHHKHWQCLENCNAIFQTADAFRRHLQSKHGYSEHKDQVEELLETCKRHLSSQKDFECVLCRIHLPSLSQLRRHLGKHQQELALFALPPHTRGGHEDDDGLVSNEDSQSSSGDESLAAPSTVEEDTCPICHEVFEGQYNRRKASLAMHMDSEHTFQERDAIGGSYRPQLNLPYVRASLDRSNARDRSELLLRYARMWLEKRGRTYTAAEPRTSDASAVAIDLEVGHTALQTSMGGSKGSVISGRLSPEDSTWATVGKSGLNVDTETDFHDGYLGPINEKLALPPSGHPWLLSSPTPTSNTSMTLQRPLTLVIYASHYKLYSGP